MAIYYISAKINNEDVVFAMDATTTIKKSSGGVISQNKMEDGRMASDNYRNTPEVINLSGVISDVFVGNSISAADRKTTKEFISGLEKIKEGRVPFTTHFASDLTPRYPCFFQNLDISQGGNFGFSGVNVRGEDVNAYQVTMAISVARIGQAVTFTSAPATTFIDPVQAKVSSSSATKTDSDIDPLLVSGLVQTHTGIVQVEEGFTDTDLPGG